MRPVRTLLDFVWGAVRIVCVGSPVYYLWLAAILALIAGGGIAYAEQLEAGLIVTWGRNQSMSAKATAVAIVPMMNPFMTDPPSGARHGRR